MARERLEQGLAGAVDVEGGREVMTAAAKYPEVDKLADELFSKIQRAQGYAFISDGETFPTKEQFFERIRGRLAYQRKGVRIMADFLRKYGELHGAKQ